MLLETTKCFSFYLVKGNYYKVLLLLKIFKKKKYTIMTASATVTLKTGNIVPALPSPSFGQIQG